LDPILNLIKKPCDDDTFKLMSTICKSQRQHCPVDK